MRLHRFCLAATRLPHSPPRRHLHYRGSVGPQKPDPLQGKAVRPPNPLWLFPAWGDLARYSDRHPVHPPAHPYGFARFAYPRAVRPPRHVPRQRMGGGTAGMFCPRRAGRNGRKGRRPLPLLCAGLLKASKAWNRQWPAMQGIATGRAVAAVSMRKGEPSVISRAFSP